MARKVVVVPNRLLNEVVRLIRKGLASEALFFARGWLALEVLKAKFKVFTGLAGSC
jgi:hypothetical protein